MGNKTLLKIVSERELESWLEYCEILYRERKIHPRIKPNEHCSYTNPSSLKPRIAEVINYR